MDPAGPEAEEAQVAHGVSSCMLVAAWLLGWRGRFVGDTIQTTLRGLWGGTTGRVPGVEGPPFDLGAQVWWAAAGAEPEHVDACVLSVTAITGGYSIQAVAGGQRVTQADVDAGTFGADQLGERCIKIVTRTVVLRGTAWVDAGTGRRVLGVRDAT